MPDEPNAFAGLMSALGLMVVLIVITATAIIIGIGTGSTLAGVLVWLAITMWTGMCLWKSPD